VNVIPTDITISIPKIPVEPREVTLSDADINAIFSSIETHRPYLLPIVKFAIKVPSRVGELLRLSQDSVDGEYLRITGKLTKSGKGVTKPQPPELQSYFNEGLPQDIESVFYRTDNNGNKIPLKRFTKAWNFCIEKAGLKDIRFHDLRHYSATKMLRAGISERDIMSTAGWVTPMLSTYFQKDSEKSSNIALELMKQGKL